MADFPVMGAPNAGDTAWMLASSALVLLMTPGLAFEAEHAETAYDLATVGPGSAFTLAQQGGNQ